MLLAGSVFAQAVFAQAPARAEDAVVEALIQRGIQLRRNSADEEALAVFLEAEKQDPRSVRVLLHIVTAAQAAGKWLLADSYMRKVAALSDDPYYQRHASAIDVVRRAIAARVGSFQVDGEPDGASVRLDGQLVGTLPMSEPASVEAGTYMLEVHKPGYYRLRRNVIITGGVLTREPVELNQVAARADVSAGGGSLASGGPVGADESGNRSWWASPAVGWSLLGVGVASGVMSGVAFQIREDRAATWNDENECVPANGDTREERCGNFREDAETYQTIGIVTGVAGAVLAGTGLALLLSGGDDEEKPQSAEASPKRLGSWKITGCDIGFATIGCRGSF